jgi:glucose/galactose transporter
MAIGLGVMAVGSIIFIPAAQIRSYPLFLVGFFIQTTGMTLLQTASNPYVTILGPIESAAKRISIMGICNKVAGMIGIFILVKLLFNDTQTLSERIQALSGTELENELNILASRVTIPYIIMAVALTILSLMILKAHLPEISPESDSQSSNLSKAEKKSVFDFPHLTLGVICIFVYVGVEVIAIDTIGLYGRYQGFELNVAGNFSIFSLIALSIGYILAIVITPKYISQRMTLVISATLGFVFAIGALLTSGWISIGFIVLLSFAHAFMWPAIWPLALSELGSFTKTASALLIMGIVGGGLIPLVYGALADSSNRQTAYLVTLPCYLYILFFASKGYRVGKTIPAKAVGAGAL